MFKFHAGSLATTEKKVQTTKTELAFNACIRSNSEATYTLVERTETLIKELKKKSQFLPFVYGLHG